MERYPIPQFIEQEGRIAFFISFRQFFYLVGAGAISFILFFVLPIYLFIMAFLLLMGSAVVLGFVTVNGMPIGNMLLSSIGFMTGSKNYTWKKKESPYPFTPVKRVEIKKIEEGAPIRAQESKLRKIRTDVELKTK